MIKDVRHFLRCFYKSLSDCLLLMADNNRMSFIKVEDAFDNKNNLLIKDKDIYFCPNESNKESHIFQLNCCFVDLDCGRDKNGKYFPLKKVAAFKRKALTKIYEFPVAPTIIVVTRNGYQVYWLFNKPLSKQHYISTWNGLQRKIHSFFKECGADGRVLKANQIMRLPFTNWVKKKEGYPNFSCTIHTYNKNKIDITTLKNALCDIKVATNTIYGNSPTSYNITNSKKIQKQFNVFTNDSESTVKIPNTTGLIKEVVDFLGDVNTVLYMKNAKYLARKASDLQQELRNQFTIF